MGAIVRVLGPLQVAVDGALISIGGERQRAIVAALALNANRAVAIHELSAALWDDTTADHGHRLQQQVSSVRKLLEPNRPKGVEPSVLVTAPPGYALHCDQVDVDQFEDASRRGAAAASKTDWTSALTALDEALGCWHGAALADVRVTSWFDANAARLEERWRNVSESRIDVLLALGDTAGAIHALDALVAANPLRERFRAQLMLALYRSDRQAEALGVFKQTRALLVDELGIEPGLELQQLERAILQQDPNLRLDTSVAPPADPGPELYATYKADDLGGGYVERPDGQIITLADDSSVIGRDPEARVRLDDSRVSRRHARIDREGGGYLVSDLGSTNGTTVNGHPADATPLADGDTIGIGSIELVFRTS